MSRKYPHAYAAFQLGKGLVGFLAGLVLATMIIIAVLLMLNSNSKSVRREPNLSQTPPTETLTPKGAKDNVSPTQPETPPAPTVKTLDTPPPMPTHTSTEPLPSTQTNTTGSDMTSHETNLNTPNTTDNHQAHQTLDEHDITDVRPIEKPPIVANKPPVKNIDESDELNHDIPAHRPNNTNTTTDNTNNNKTPSGTRQPSASGSLKNDDLQIKEPTPVRKQTPPPKVKPKPETKPETKKPSPEKPKLTPSRPNNPNNDDVKPSPQQILDSGQANKTRETNAKPNNKTTHQNTTTNTKRVNNSNGVVIQAGAYSSRGAAESQRARLALLGVQAKIVEANVNGKTTFRVQTSRMEGSQINQTRNLLERNGVSTLERSAD